MANNVQVHAEGPLFDGLAPVIVDRLLIEQVAELADYARYEVVTQLDSVLVNPTGFYVSQIVDKPLSPYLHSVNDSGVIYGPWLEGTSSRNQTSRFKGYHTFRIVKNRLAQKKQAILAALSARITGRV